ncbi:TPA: hypothetical protein N0F65_003921 [Lagenidium giganteum]|uniref:histone acetyltransferase n=1 Tax=Lagenidium giganteum TaxID=4803 RepID=A0AAV2ZA64_9STRA|nr:TPA: hypothetical protein N0F65_003921 [Lagenidium giganteum]
MAAARAGIAVRVQTDLKNAFTTGLNKSVPVGWDPSIKTGKEHLKHVDPLGQMSAGELREHINALRREGRVKSFEKLSEILHKLMADPRNRHGVFNTPVDPEAMDLPTYNEIIKKPMDLGTIDSRLQQGQYLDIQDFIADVRLVFENAMVFNPRTHYIHVDAEILWRKFDAIMSGEGDRQIKRMLSPRGHVCHACMGHTCTICEQQCLQFTLPHLQCSGNCGTDIRKGSIYFVTRDGSRVWCHKCRNRTARETEPSGGRKGKKKRGKGAEEPPVPGVTNIQEYGDLVKKKCEVEVEPWVKCFECDRWLHQICGMYNPVQGIYCANNDRALTESTSVSANADTVIPTCKLSNFIQEFLRRELEGVGETSAAQTLYVRVLSFAGERMVIPEAVNKAFQENTTALAHSCPDRDVSGQVLPAQVPYTSRGIYLFQKHEGLDVCLFGLYVQEFGDDCPLVANRRSVYIAYLDSVRYLTPASARTVAYHFIMMAYFDYVRRNGFERVHIWSCPPQKRISYVFWCRPSFQKTPSAEHLRAWYNRLLDKAKARHIVKGWSTMYDRYFINVDSTQIPFEDSAGAAPIATRGVTSRVVDPNDHVWPTHQLPPLFDGDFIPAELDRILGRIAARNGKVRRSTQYGGKSTTIGSAGGKYGIIGGRAVRIKEEQPTQPQVEAKLREVFDKCQFAVQRLKNDLLVVDLAVDTTVATPCAPQLDVPAWSTSVPRFFGSRFMFHQLCSSAGYQFDTLRRAKHSTMMMLHHYLNEQVPQANTFCAECHLLISHVNLWRCSMCPRFALCDWCHRHRTDRHPHPLELRNVQTHQVVQASELLPPPAI